MKLAKEDTGKIRMEKNFKAGQGSQRVVESAKEMYELDVRLLSSAEARTFR